MRCRPEATKSQRCTVGKQLAMRCRFTVTEALRLIEYAAGDKVIFKGGTSLSKGWVSVRPSAGPFRCEEAQRA